MVSAIQQAVRMLIALYMICVSQTDAHGHMSEPPARSSMWRYGFNTPINYNDNQLFCGGYEVQWGQNGGRCGICGDPFNGRRENEAGGMYATGTIARRYLEGQTITVAFDIMANHGGYFEIRLCPNESPSRPATESCLNQNLLRQPSGETKWQIPTGTGRFSLNLVLPRGLTCSQCVMQWKWNTASNWDCDANNNCCKGCGPQEQYYGCADVAVAPADTSASVNQGSSFMQNVFGGNSTPKVTTSGGSGVGFIPVGNVGNTGTSPICEATAVWKTKFAYADKWCKTQCAAGNCPLQYCEDGCRLLYG